MTALAARRLYVLDLARRLGDMDCGEALLHPLEYRVIARRLKQALAGLPEVLLVGVAPDELAALIPLLEARHFDEHGVLRGEHAESSRAEARALMRRLGCRCR
ncbi:MULTISPECIES: hypothetical protein [Rubrivivax]|uniref:Uncharacterized protein n=1 Tax=Rubrivivax benzoatilyticus TaxID=316997 RepID=A0ABX0I4K7_9BURK|nr:MULTISPECIES: hypothetical protein [Rubrivivax]MCD0416741.1 hypothetical protein [Rubrivivax sp. JA1024]EGJ10146.1 hypothetical protein RBXJA2T_07453 [Rubrivivax benzoatilyticus JA2 = ATCC BAA-35]MCC9597284.1 hypothetical protein [Rubrivivax sp. JA1055]MCC9646458.1 hypothetical protein [Rubrivivax sp. JA1029]NHL00471.1 hypothetical protein [Rubrivivax benzoatilyticus]